MLRSADGGEVMRRLLGSTLQAVVDAEATVHIGAGPHERTESRTTQRNGTRDKRGRQGLRRLRESWPYSRGGRGKRLRAAIHPRGGTLQRNRRHLPRATGGNGLLDLQFASARRRRPGSSDVRLRSSRRRRTDPPGGRCRRTRRRARNSSRHARSNRRHLQRLRHRGLGGRVRSCEWRARHCRHRKRSPRPPVGPPSGSWRSRRLPSDSI
jgi:hypothetical protein